MTKVTAEPRNKALRVPEQIEPAAIGKRKLVYARCRCSTGYAVAAVFTAHSAVVVMHRLPIKGNFLTMTDALTFLTRFIQKIGILSKLL